MSATSHLDGAIADGIHRMQVRVYYEDTDFSGIVYHANYLRFMERGRTNYLRLLGADQHALFAEAESEAPGFAFVVRAMQLDFLKPSKMDDLLDVLTRPLDVKGASITLHQEVRRGGRTLARGQGEGCVCFRRPRAADSEGATYRHEGRSGLTIDCKNLRLNDPRPRRCRCLVAPVRGR